MTKGKESRNKSSTQMRRLRLVFKGRVQGVGFRFTAERIALEMNVTGWVRNLRDGNVEMVVEGPEEALMSTLERIKSSEVGGYIQTTQLDWQDYRNEFSDFRIEFIY